MAHDEVHPCFCGCAQSPVGRTFSSCDWLWESDTTCCYQRKRPGETLVSSIFHTLHNLLSKKLNLLSVSAVGKVDALSWSHKHPWSQRSNKSISRELLDKTHCWKWEWHHQCSSGWENVIFCLYPGFILLHWWMFQGFVSEFWSPAWKTWAFKRNCRFDVGFKHLHMSVVVCNQRLGGCFTLKTKMTVENSTLSVGMYS